MTKLFRFLGTTLIISLLLTPILVSAHVMVSPSKVGIGEHQTFSVSVPNEKPSNTVSQIKLLIPSGVTEIQPTVKPNWEIKTEKSSSGDNAEITSITWSGGNIGVGLEDNFSFSALVPSTARDLEWKVYQTYEDGKTVAWDQPTSASEKEGIKGPLSITKVVNDLTPAAASHTNNNFVLAVAFAALIVSIFSFLRSNQNIKKSTPHL